MMGTLLLWALCGCLPGTPGTPSTCADCHGAGDNPAPPAALGGATDPSVRGVGAHTIHLEGTGIGAPVACTECHIVPGSVDAEGHIDTSWPAEVKWGDLSKTAGITDATWDAQTLSCANLYCHGATLKGGTATEPVWTLTDGSQTGCTGCHSMPPPAPHVDDATCENCHGPTATPGGFDASHHVDGVVDLSTESTSSCAGCHGTDEDHLAPPPDTQGNTDTSEISVGAHEAHLGPGEVSDGFACSTCHLIPTAVDDDGHIDAAPAEVVFSGLAVQDGASPSYDPQTATCGGGHCHGANSSGGSTSEVVWTTVDGTQDACGTCHGLPPTVGHPASSNCENCHDTAGPDQTIIDTARHIDGVVQ